MTNKIDMPFGMYTRIETLAGGTWASDLSFARAAWSKFNKNGRLPSEREFRRSFLTALFQLRSKVRSSKY